MPSTLAPLSLAGREVETIIRNVTGRQDLVVEPSDTLGATDGTKVFIKSELLNAAMTDLDERRRLGGVALHEAGHVMWSDFKMVSRIQQGKKFPKLAAHVLNMLEDPRIETFMVNLHPLSQAFLNAIHTHMNEGTVYRLNLSPRLDPGQLPIEPAAKLIRAWHRRLYMGLPSIGLGRLWPWYRLGLEALPPAYWYACSGQETYERADRLYAILERVAISEEAAPNPDTANYGNGDGDPVATGELSAGVKPTPVNAVRGITANTGGTMPSQPSSTDSPPDSVHTDVGAPKTKISLDRYLVPLQDSHDPLEWISQRADNGSIHTEGNYPVRVERPPIQAQEYSKLVAELMPLVRKLETTLETTLRFEEDLEDGQLQGKIDRRALPYVFNRDDVFARRLTNRTAGEFAVQILVDASGSMAGIMQSVRAGTIVVHEALRRLNIQHGVTAHTTDGESVLLQDYVRPDSTRADSFRLVSMAAAGANRDGTAIRTVGTYLQKRAEPFKLLLVLSDGLPSEYTSSENAVADTKAAVRDLEVNAQVVGIWLGSSRAPNQFKAIYKNHVQCQTIKELPNAIGKELQKVCGLR